MRVLRHIGSPFPERDGGAVIAQRRDGSVWLLSVYEGGNPGDMLEVEAFDLGKTERGYRAFMERLSERLGFDNDPAVAAGEIGDEINLTGTATRRLASSIDGRATLVSRLGAEGWWPDIDTDPSEVPYSHIQRVWTAPSKQQRHFNFNNGIRE